MYIRRLVDFVRSILDKIKDKRATWIITKRNRKFFRELAKKNLVFRCASYRLETLVTLPDNFDLEQHIAQYPPEQYFRSRLGFNKDKAYYFLGLITSIPARNSDIITEDGYTPIHLPTIQGRKKGDQCIKDIISYKNYLINTGVIICNGTYTVGKMSLGYKWSQQYSRVSVSARSFESRYTDAVVEYEQSGDIEAYPYLFHWYQQNRLTIDEDAAKNHAFQLFQDKMNDPASWDFNNMGERKNPESQYRSSILNISKIRNCRYEAHIDNNVHRLHSAFTGLGKKYRRFVTYDGKKLVGIDIKNSQPYIISLILNRDFWSENSILPLNINTLPANIQEAMRTPYELSTMLGGYFDNVSEEDFTAYKNLVSSGQFYEKFVDVVRDLGEEITRDEAKIMMFHILYSPNVGQHKNWVINEMKKIFKGIFPKVAELFKIIKRDFQNVDIEKQHNRLARLLQSIESEIVLHKCCKRIWEEGNQQVPVFTIHDNIVTTEGNEDFVHRIMYEELERYIGISPPLSEPETWE